MVRLGAMRALVALVVAVAGAAAAAPPPPVAPVAPLTPWVTTSCWVEPRWFETLRNGPVDFCKRSLRFRPGQIDCLAFTDEICWAFRSDTGEWTQLRNPGRENLIVCPDAPEPPTCPRMH
jgi:hypothetical protein